MRIPMQIYLDPETVDIYKEYARKEDISFAALIRQAVDEKREKIAPTKKKKNSNKIKGYSLLQALQEARKKIKDVKIIDYYPELDEDEIIAAHEMQELDR